MKSRRPPMLSWLAAAIALAAALLLIVGFFLHMPTEGTTLALDWISIRAGLEDWDLAYAVENGLRYPPWSAALLLPLAQIPMGAGWGVIAFLTLAVLSLCLPGGTRPGRTRILAIFALALSYPALRTIADGNIEFLVLAGLVILERGLIGKKPVLAGVGLLLAATKVQETWILILALPLLAGKEWFPRRGAGALGTAAAVGLPAMAWRGREWLLSIVTSPFRGSIMDSSLLATAQRLIGIPWAACLIWCGMAAATVFVCARHLRGFSREAFGFLLAASLLLAPYAAGNNVLIVYALGVVPMLVLRRGEGILLAALVNLPFLLIPFRELNYQCSASYWTLVLLLAWLLFALRLRENRKKGPSAAGVIGGGENTRGEAETAAVSAGRGFGFRKRQNSGIRFCLTLGNFPG
ncbi:MAG: DUF2029 domain-containing protein [Anaerolineales bacterium]|nr:DUF2029 domain-containing protein [Anaerolineales bacterium]